MRSYIQGPLKRGNKAFPTSVDLFLYQIGAGTVGGLWALVESNRLWSYYSAVWVRGKIKTDKNKVTSHAAFLRKHVPGRKRKQPSAFIPSSFHVAEERHVASLQPFPTNAAGCRSLSDSGQCLNDPKLPSFLFLIFIFFFLQCHLCTTTTGEKKNRSLKKNHGSKLRIQEKKK